jgi:hypothetical protein
VAKLHKLIAHQQSVKLDKLDFRFTHELGSNLEKRLRVVLRTILKNSIKGLSIMSKKRMADKLPMSLKSTLWTVNPMNSYAESKACLRIACMLQMVIG